MKRKRKIAGRIVRVRNNSALEMRSEMLFDWAGVDLNEICGPEDIDESEWMIGCGTAAARRRASGVGSL